MFMPGSVYRDFYYRVIEIYLNKNKYIKRKKLKLKKRNYIQLSLKKK